MSMAAAVTTADFEGTVLKAETPVLVDFWAPWCGPCRALAPKLDAVAAELGGKVKIVKVNVDEETELAARYQIMSIPALLVFKGGKVVDQIVGNVPQQMISQTLNNHV